MFKKIMVKIYNRVSQQLLVQQKEQWEKLYGLFDSNDYEEYRLNELPDESGFYHGEIIKWARDLTPQRVLFAGENSKSAHVIKDAIHAECIVTAGLGTCDLQWNFEENPPVVDMPFDLIISQAILEHLLNPYKHLHDLVSLLQPNGHLILHTVIPGFPFHRYPIDAVRFFPDWFEEAALKLKLSVERKRLRYTHIFYCFKK
jgi:SAM-dependent methyltransferase